MCGKIHFKNWARFKPIQFIELIEINAKFKWPLKGRQIHHWSAQIFRLFCSILKLFEWTTMETFCACKNFTFALAKSVIRSIFSNAPFLFHTHTLSLNLIHLINKHIHTYDALCFKIVFHSKSVSHTIWNEIESSKNLEGERPHRMRLIRFSEFISHLSSAFERKRLCKCVCVCV